MQLTKTMFSDSAIFIEKMTVENRLWAKSEFLCQFLFIHAPWSVTAGRELRQFSRIVFRGGKQFIGTGQSNHRLGPGPGPSAGSGPRQIQTRIQGPADQVRPGLHRPQRGRRRCHRPGQQVEAAPAAEPAATATATFPLAANMNRRHGDSLHSRAAAAHWPPRPIGSRAAAAHWHVELQPLPRRSVLAP